MLFIPVILPSAVAEKPPPTYMVLPTVNSAFTVTIHPNVGNLRPCAILQT